MSYLAAPERYEGKMGHRRCGRSGLDLPLLSLGYWHNFGDERPFETQRGRSISGQKRGAASGEPAPLPPDRSLRTQ